MGPSPGKDFVSIALGPPKVMEISFRSCSFLALLGTSKTLTHIVWSIAEAPGARST
jgi:hypothetical protein